MKIYDCDAVRFADFFKLKKLICFGAGATGKAMCEELNTFHIEDNIAFFVDNDKNKQGSEIEINGKKFSVYSADILREEYSNEYLIYVTSRFWHEILEQLNEIPELDNIDCFVDIIIRMNTSTSDASGLKYLKKEQHIPKTIHYIWFGNSPMPDFAKKNIASWKKYMPDYEIIEWNEKNYDIEKCAFSQEAKREKHWSALSSFARFDILYNHGGIYLDTDVEAVKNFDPLLNHSAFMGFDVCNFYVNSGQGFGAEKGHEFMREMVEKVYGNVSLYDENGDYRLCAVLTTNLLKKYGLKPDGTMQEVKDTFIYPSEYFDPALQMPTEKTYSVHHYSSLWNIKNKDMMSVWEKQKEYYKMLKDSKRLLQL